MRDARARTETAEAREAVRLGLTMQWRLSGQRGRGWVPWRPGRYLPREWTTTVDGDGLPYVARLSFTAEEGDWRCEEVAFVRRDDGKPIGSEAVRGMPVARLIELAVSWASARGAESDGVLSIEFGHGLGDATADLALATPGRPARLSDEHLRRVAEVYEAADSNPVQAVWDAFDFVPSRTTCARWVEQARKRGFLPPTTRGRATAGKGKSR